MTQRHGVESELLLYSLSAHKLWVVEILDVSMEYEGAMPCRYGRSCPSVSSSCCELSAPRRPGVLASASATVQ